MAVTQFFISGREQTERLAEAILQSDQEPPVRVPVSAREITEEAELARFVETGGSRAQEPLAEAGGSRPREPFAEAGGSRAQRSFAETGGSRPQEPFVVVNLRLYAEGKAPSLGEQALRQVLNAFSCPDAPEAERFLKERAVSAAAQKEAATYLVFSAGDGTLAGYFTLALRTLTVACGDRDARTEQALQRVGMPEAEDTYRLPVYLLAQMGKSGAGRAISWEDLLELAVVQMKRLQYLCGGVISALQAQPREDVLAFCGRSRFYRFWTGRDGEDGQETAAFLRLL